MLVFAAGVLCFDSGGFFHEPRATLAVAAWLLVAVVALSPIGPQLLPLGGAARAALAGLLGLAAWTALSLLWAPMLDPAREDVARLALYAAVLPLAVVAFHGGWPARALEPALVAVATIVVGYGLLGKAGAIDVDVSLAADGRLDQPLSYWNAMGAMAALGLLLAVRMAIDRTRPALHRAIACACVALLALGLYLTYSRGALAAAALGLAVVVLLAPELAPFWRRVGRRWRLAVGWTAIAAIAVAMVVVASDRASAPARGATAERFSDIGSNRADYWRVAVQSFADDPLLGNGSAAFRVEWLREREVREGAFDAHSIYLETGAELGLVGLLLLAAFVGGIALCSVRAARFDPGLAAGPCAALSALAFHAGVDWDWEMPALVLPALMLAGVVIGAQRQPVAR